MASDTDGANPRRGTRSKRPAQRYMPEPTGSQDAASIRADTLPTEAKKRRRALPSEEEEKEEEEEEEEDDKVYCVCRKQDNGSPMICCSVCGEWYHLKCMGLSKRVADAMDEYVCDPCEKSTSVGETRSKDENEDEFKEEDAQEDEGVDDDAYEKASSDENERPTRNVAPRRAARAAVSRKRAKTSTTDPVRVHVLTTFTSIFTPLFAAHDAEQAREKANIYAEELEHELHAMLGNKEKGRLYKERFRTLSFNLKDQRNTSLHRRITSNALSATELAHLNNEELANDTIRVATEKAKRDALQQSVLREQADGPARKITHKGEVDIERENAPYAPPQAVEEPAPAKQEAPEQESKEPEAASATPSPPKTHPSLDFARAWKDAVHSPRNQESAPTDTFDFDFDTTYTPAPEPEADALADGAREANDASGDADTYIDSFLDDPGASVQDAPLAKSTTPPGTPPPNALGRVRHAKPRAVPLEAQPVVWDGVVTMPEFTSAYVHARQLSAPLYKPDSPLWPAIFAGTECMVEGRLPDRTAIDYLLQVRHSPRNDTLLLVLDAGGDIDAPERHHETNDTLHSSASLDKLVHYFADKNRFGVLTSAPGTQGTLVKDFYIAPLRAHTEVPDWVYALRPDGLGKKWHASRPANILLVVLVFFKSALETQLREPHAFAPAPAPVRPPAPAPVHAPNAPTPVALDALLNVNPDAIQNLLSTLGNARPPGAPPGVVPFPPPMRPPPIEHQSIPPPGVPPPPPMARPMRAWGPSAPPGESRGPPLPWDAPRPPFPGYGLPEAPPGFNTSRGGWYGGNTDRSSTSPYNGPRKQHGGRRRER
ncbi:Transcription factor bye1 [Malassezia vespertilionis]|uniref:Transcription factor BYE1 n=1 Tax=Malassezia vespertilionis TaxID=2020962 RepID=A0A2N1JD65_9BASI|nr:Transcription factor bye1 [Malassezia vespertilionis]PKI84486.1 hypothetical protein MVES_001482 [Malassezia vespertilionis]WFD06230.1 Transcription factor bye1 [Malassezia vespertilionis]